MRTKTLLNIGKDFDHVLSGALVAETKQNTELVNFQWTAVCPSEDLCIFWVSSVIIFNFI